MIDAKIMSVNVLTGGHAMLADDGMGLWMPLTPKALTSAEGQPAIVITFELDRPAIEIMPVDVPKPPSGSVARASNRHRLQRLQVHGRVRAGHGVR